MTITCTGIGITVLATLVRLETEGGSVGMAYGQCRLGHCSLHLS